jgi:hypothetical protein
MDHFKLLRDFWDFAFENPEKISPNHCALYCFIINHSNRLGQKIKLGLPTEMAKEAIGIKSYNTYINTLNDLVGWGFIKLLERSKNQYSSNIVALSYFDKALDKALDKAMLMQQRKQSESSSESISESISSIDKLITNKEELITKREERENFALSFLEINHPSDHEVLTMQFKKQINDYEKFLQMFEATIEQEGLEFKKNVIVGRFKKYALNWISNQNKFDAPVIDLNANQNQPQRKLFKG